MDFRKKDDLFGLERQSQGVYLPEFARRKTYAKKHTINNGEAKTISFPIVIGNSLQSLTVISNQDVTLLFNEDDKDHYNKDYRDIEVSADTPYMFGEEVYSVKISNSSGSNAIVKLNGSIQHDSVHIEK